jgi:hypothetical protein
MSGIHHIRGADVLRDMANACGAKKPGALRSTKLRKHIATMAQVLNLKTHELDQLARFMGHDINVHREFYRLPEETCQVAKISKMLIALEEGKIHNFAGKSLAEIDWNLDEELECEYNYLCAINNAYSLKLPPLPLPPA